MRIIVKILLSIIIFIVGIALELSLQETGGNKVGIIRLFPWIIIIFGIIGVWRYKKPNNGEDNKLENKNLDKTL